WFGAPGDGTAADRWMHWAAGRAPAAGRVTFELYPDTRRLPRDALFDTELAPLGDGRPARLYSAPAAVDTHFAWMAEHDLDGVALQRFLADLGDGGVKRFRDEVARRVRDAAERHGRVFYLEYDISGADPAAWPDQL